MLMTTPLACRSFAAPARASFRRAVLRVEGLPRKLRPVVEDLMQRCLPTQPPAQPSGTLDDLLAAADCTHWNPDPGHRGAVRCAQELKAPRRELEDLAVQLEELAAAHRFRAELTWR